MESINIPDKKVVSIPAYPGSQIIQTSEKTDDMLPSIRLVSDDSTKKVIEFYKNELTDWKYEDFYGVHMFWESEDKMKAMMGQEPVVQVESNEKFIHLVPSAKTTILIGYSPKK
jgi:hypothetical protein